MAFMAVALLKLALLSGLNRQWLRVGIMLGKAVSPIALGVLFYGVVTPLGALFGLSGKDLLRLKRDIGADPYWIPRKPAGPPPDSMTNQF